MRFIDADEDTFKVQSVDILVSQNGKAHYTYDYELMERSENAELVVRRGQPFQLLLNCNRDYQPANDAVSLVFTVAGVTLLFYISQNTFTCNLVYVHFKRPALPGELCIKKPIMS